MSSTKIISSPKTLGSLCALIVYPSVVVRSFPFFKHLLLIPLANQDQTSYGPSLRNGTRVCINGLGHLTKMTPMSIYGLKVSSSEPEVRRY